MVDFIIIMLVCGSVYLVWVLIKTYREIYNMLKDL